PLRMRTSANSNFVEFVQPARPVGHETSREKILAVRIYGWQHVTGRQSDNGITLGQEERFTADHECADPLADEGREDRLKLVGSACGRNDKASAEGTLRICYDLPFARGLRCVGRIDKNSDRRGRRH